MIKILFVCLGNICRSPMAKCIMQDLIRRKGMEKNFEIDSAATSDEEVGNGIYPLAKKKLQEKGIACQEHIAKKMKPEDYQRFDYIIGMEKNNCENIIRIVGKDEKGKIFCLLDFSSNPRDISDPWYTRDFEKAYQDIREGCEELLAKLCS